MASDKTYPDVTVKLTDGSGNAFAIIGAVNRAITKAHGAAAGAEWSKGAMDCGSYDELLCLAMDTVNVE